MALVRWLRAGIVSGLGFVAGCSLIYGDTIDKKQCEVPDDCTVEGESVLYECVDNTCQVSTARVPCKQDRDCITDGVAASSRRCGYDNLCYDAWACIDAPSDWPTTVTPFHFQTVVGLLGGGPIGDVETKAFAATDQSYANPIATGTQTDRGDSTTLIDVPFTAPFSGTIRVKPKPDAGYYDSYIYIPSKFPLVTNFITEKQTYPSTPETIAGLSKVPGATIKEGNVLIGFQLNDCGGRPATGVTGKIDSRAAPDAKFIPLLDMIPLPDQTATNDYGVAIMTNVPSQKQASIQLVEEATGKNLFNASAIPEPNTSHFVVFYPSYAAVKLWMAEYKRRNPDAGIAQ